MVQLVPMNEDDFQTYSQYAISEYAQEYVKVGYWQAEEALEQATRQYQELLPAGHATKDQFLYMLKEGEQSVGILWFGLKESPNPSAFVYDIRVFEQFRRHGYASKAFRLMEEKVRELGLNKIMLQVFGPNHGAREMYKNLGYQEVVVLMSKDL